MKKKVAIIGECMLELSTSAKPGFGVSTDTSKKIPMQLSYGGDTLNTAVYLSRLGVDVSYFTALGDDSYSDWLLQQWREEGVGCDCVMQMSGRLPGIYAIETNPDGERSFHYWRDQAPARDLLNDKFMRDQLFQHLSEFDVIYFSGITLSLYPQPVLDKLFTFLETFRAEGGQVAFDSNFRPNRWPDKQSAKAIFERAWRLVDIALPTLDDELALFSDDSNCDVIKRLTDLGVKEVVLKQGVEGSLVVSEGEATRVPAEHIVNVVDTTAAGDSFNAAYLANRLWGKTCAQAAAEGHALAGIVVQYPGAIIPADTLTNRLR